MIEEGSIVGNRYKEVLLKVRNFALHRRDDPNEGYVTNGYIAMIGHDCPKREKYYLRNGERHPVCSECGEHIPDEIWGLWQLMCNDQRQGIKP